MPDDPKPWTPTVPYTPEQLAMHSRHKRKVEAFNKRFLKPLPHGADAGAAAGSAAGIIQPSESSESEQTRGESGAR